MNPAPFGSMRIKKVVAPELIERGLELIAIPAVHVLREGGRWTYLAANPSFRSAGFGATADRSPMLAALGERIEGFLASDALTRDWSWTFGEAIDARHYQVTAARSGLEFDDRCTLSFVDHTARVRTERSLRREMTTDSLTGLPNREGFGDVVDAVGARRDRYGVLVIDLKRFGRLNACLGSLAGDELLISVARRIKGALRARDGLARIGGDEFGVLLEIDEDRAEAEEVARRIEGALATPFRLSDYRIRVECSIGIAFGADRAEEREGWGDELVRHAQFAAKRAKESGRTETYQLRAFTAARRQFALETQLRRAVENRTLRHEYQPICELRTGRLIAFEALARWTDEEGRAVSPNEFIPVAEESGLIVPLGRWAIEEATRTLAGWDRRAGGDCGVRMSVNLSPIQLQRDDIPAAVAGALAASGLEGRRLKLELTESALVVDPERTTALLFALKELGAKIAMDDFGTGYSNLAHLQKLPIDILKIDRSLVSGMLADRDKVALVRAVLSLAQALGMETVAEGVEDGELARTLGSLGCMKGQGYFYARPLSPEAAFEFISADAASGFIASATA